MPPKSRACRGRVLASLQLPEDGLGRRDLELTGLLHLDTCSRPHRRPRSRSAGRACPCRSRSHRARGRAPWRSRHCRRRASAPCRRRPSALPHAFMTNTSLTAMQAIVSTPLARIWSASCTKPGRCLASQVGVNAPGTENSTTFLPLKSSSVVMSFGPSLVIVLSVPAGMRSPALIAIRVSFL